MKCVLVAFAIVCAGCARPASIAPPHDGADKVVKHPPASRGGNQTGSGCSGITERGDCQTDGGHQVAVTCDVSSNMIRKIDCTALGKSCVLDTTRGPRCTNDQATCASGLTYAGVCQGSVATWCDTDSGITYVWDCAADGLNCETDTCERGAYCCPGDGSTGIND